MITLGGKTIATTEAEKLLIELGGSDPGRVYTEEELSDRLGKAIEALPADSPVLKKIFGALTPEEVKKYS